MFLAIINYPTNLCDGDAKTIQSLNIIKMYPDDIKKKIASTTL